MDRLLWLFTILPHWIARRDWRLVLQGSPALIAAILSLTAVVAVASRSHDRSQRHLQLAQEMNRVGDHRAALVYAEAAVHARPDDRAAQLELALAAAGTGDTERATALLNTLAPSDRVGYGPAHLLIAQNILVQPAPTLEQLRTAEAHLIRADEGFDVPKDEVNLLLGEVYLNTGRLPQAKERLARAGSLMPARLRLGQIAAAQGDYSRAHSEGEECRHFFAAKLRSAPSNIGFRIFLAEAHVLKGEFPQALTVVDEGLALAPDHPQLRALRAGVFVHWMATLDRTPTTPADVKLRVLERGLTLEPANAVLLLRLWALSDTAGPKSAEARTLLREHLATGKNPAVAHFILGTAAYQEGKADEARLHLEQAYKVGPKLAVIGNNLAWVLADRAPPQLDRALEVIDGVLMNSPGNPRYRGTRGYVLVKMGRWRDAIADLEASLARPDVEAETHELLAEAYTHLGDTRMAEQHRQLSKTRPRRTPAKK